MTKQLQYNSLPVTIKTSSHFTTHIRAFQEKHCIIIPDISQDSQQSSSDTDACIGNEFTENKPYVYISGSSRDKKKPKNWLIERILWQVRLW